MGDLSNQQLKQEDFIDKDFLYLMLFNNSLDAVLFAVPDGTIINANNAACTMFGRTVDELREYGRYCIMDEADPRLNVALEERDHTGRFFGELTCLRKDGSKFPVELSSSKFEDKAGNKFTSIIIRDITQRKQLERDLLEKNGLLSLFIKNSPIYSYIKEVTPSESKVIFASENFIEMTGIKGSEMIGKNMFELFPADFAEKMTRDDMNVVSEGTMLKLEEELNYKNYTSFKFPIEQGKKTFLAGYTIDVTELKHSELELKESERRLRELNFTKDKFFSIIAHDLRSPFSSIMGFSNILACQIMEHDYEGVEKYAEIIQQSSQRAMDLLSNLLEWSRSQTGMIQFNPEFFELRRLISEIIVLFNDASRQKSINITIQGSRNFPVVADRAMISTVLRNLISNAIKFTFPGGTVNISAEQKDHEITIAIQDNGVGIGKEVLEKLFRINETNSTSGTENERGTGLGLLLCKDFVEKHSGKIWVKSKKNAGSTFFFSLPMSL